MVLANLIGGFIVIIVGLNLIPSISQTIRNAQFTNETSGNVSNIGSAASAILGLTNLFFAIGIMAAGIGLATEGMRQAGIF